MIELTYSTVYGLAAGVVLAVIGMVIATYVDYHMDERRKDANHKNRRSA